MNENTQTKTAPGGISGQEHNRLGLAFLVLCAIAMGGVWWVWGPEIPVTDPPARGLIELLQELPGQTVFYIMIAIPTGGYLSWKWYIHGIVLRELEAKKSLEGEEGLSDAGWWVVRTLRLRAFALRVRAEVILAVAVALLLAGAYAMLFILPVLWKDDLTTLDEVQFDAQFVRQFGDDLGRVANGEYWFTTEENGSGPWQKNTALVKDKCPADLKEELTGEEVGLGFCYYGKDEQQENKITIGAKGSMFVRQAVDGSNSWVERTKAQLDENTWVLAAAFDAKFSHGVLVGYRASRIEATEGDGYALLGGAPEKYDPLFVTHNGGMTWNKHQNHAQMDYIDTVAFAHNSGNNHGVIVTRQREAFVTGDGGENWKKTKSDRAFSTISSLHFDADTYTAIDAAGGTHVLKEHPRLKKIAGMPMDVVGYFQRGSKELQDSALRERIMQFVEERGLGQEAEVSIAALLNLTVLRITMLAIVFFLVHVLVRLHQYNIRLATFWDSRADAMVLQNTFAKEKAESFSELVAALAPDTYDFKGGADPGRDRHPSGVLRLESTLTGSNRLDKETT